jgi:hypothetical protein
VGCYVRETTYTKEREGGWNKKPSETTGNDNEKGVGISDRAELWKTLKRREYACRDTEWEKAETQRSSDRGQKRRNEQRLEQAACPDKQCVFVRLFLKAASSRKRFGRRWSEGRKEAEEDREAQQHVEGKKPGRSYRMNPSSAVMISPGVTILNPKRLALSAAALKAKGGRQEDTRG